MKKTATILMLLSAATCAGSAQASALHLSSLARQDASISPARDSSSSLVRQLTSRDPLVRKRAAEDLAHMAATEQRRLVEGYRAQERDGRVRVALDWALYRMGKREALFQLVRALDSSRSDQAIIYLSHLETPEPLYLFLEHANGRTQAKLLQVLGYIGDASTLERIKPFAASIDPLIAEAAKTAEQEITTRLSEKKNDATPARERQRGKTDEGPPEGTSPEN